MAELPKTLTPEAAVVAQHWRHRVATRLRVEFKTPARITPEAKTGFDDLVSQGLLTRTQFRPDGVVVYEPTSPVLSRLARKVPHSWLDENRFPITSD